MIKPGINTHQTTRFVLLFITSCRTETDEVARCPVTVLAETDNKSVESAISHPQTDAPHCPVVKMNIPST